MYFHDSSATKARCPAEIANTERNGNAGTVEGVRLARVGHDHPDALDRSPQARRVDDSKRSMSAR